MQRRNAIWVSIGVHALVFGGVAGGATLLVSKTETIYDADWRAEAAPLSMNEEAPPVVEDTREMSDGSLGEPRFISDAPFEGPGTTGTIGIGGGAGGYFDGRRGGRPVNENDSASDECDDAETYAPITDTGFASAETTPLSTFAADVDTASYSNVRRFLRCGRLPPRGAVRVEEMVNYFPFSYAAPEPGHPFGVSVDVAGCPWDDARRLVRIGVQARPPAELERKTSNLVFLIDVSGSMGTPDKLPLVKESLRMLTSTLTRDDRVSIVVYAGAAGLVLPPTPCDDTTTILAALDRLESGGSTAGAAGIQLAYETARSVYIQGGINRVVLATDGDFNVGTQSHAELEDLVRKEAATGVFLSVLGYGTGNLRDDTMELLADRGNGNYAYIDCAREAQRALVERARGTLDTVAKDVKFQVEFNPARVSEYRLVGYENRALRAEDFKDDTKDGGEIGAGHVVTALYEITPTTTTAATSSLRYRSGGEPPASVSDEILTVSLRWKEPDGSKSTGADFPVRDSGAPFADASPDFRFAAAVAEFALWLRSRDGERKGDLRRIAANASATIGDDPGGYRREFTDLVSTAASLPR